ncbi:MAG: TonB-dependent receptor [Candidatus Zixiibacteriota bacterium]|nr:MAG: TonB-dependent receptor [candidate division Zixibacteria bacterium]
MKAAIRFSLLSFLSLGLLISDPGSLFCQTEWKQDFQDFSELSLEKLLDVKVSSASKHEQEISGAPAFVTVITAEMIETFNYRTVAQALRSVPGMWITCDPYSPQVGLRGIAVHGDWNSRISVLLNGHTLNEQWGGSTNVDELLGIDISHVKRIEVVKGPVSSLYGSNAFFGVINVVTKDPESVAGPHLVTGFTDQVNRTDGAFSFGRRFSKDLQILLCAAASDARGGRLFFQEYRDLEESERLALEEDGYSPYFLSLDNLTGGHTSGTDFLKSYSLFLNLTWKDFSVLSKLAHRNKGIPTGYFESVFDTDKNRMEEDFNFLEVKYQKPFSGRHKFMGRVYYDDYYFADHILYNYFSDPEEEYEDPTYLPGPMWVDEGTDKFWGTELQLDLRTTRNQRLIVGGEFQDHNVEQHSGEVDRSEERFEWDVVPSDVQSSDASIFNLYVQNEYNPVRQVNLVLGLHYSKNTHYAGRVTPKVGVIVSPQQKSIFKLLYSEGFRAPTFYERTFDDADYYIGNPGLIPEEIRSYEAVFERYMPWARMAATFYVNRAKKIISQETVDSSDPAHPGGDYQDEVFQYQNIEELEARGVEFSVERSVRNRWGGYFNLSYCLAEDKGTGERPVNSPEFLSNLGINYLWMKDRLSTALELRFVDKRMAYNGTITKSYLTTNVSVVARKIAGLFDASLVVRNVFDQEVRDPIFEDYYPVLSMKQTGRTFSIRTSFGL